MSFSAIMRDLAFLPRRARLAAKRNGFSNFNEERILARYIAELLPSNHSMTAVDIGASDGTRGSNTYALFRSGWTGLGIEAEERKFHRLARTYRPFAGVQACYGRVTQEEIVPLLQSHGIPREFSVLSLDIDGNDYWVLGAVLSAFRPQLIVTEINEKIPPPLRFVVKNDPEFRLRHHFFGYSIAMLEDLCERHGYSILELEYNNAFLAPKELAGARGVDAEAAYRRGYRDRADRKERFRSNLDMEALHSLGVDEAIAFLRKFYAREQGRYYLTADSESMAAALAADGIQTA